MLPENNYSFALALQIEKDESGKATLQTKKWSRDAEWMATEGVHLLHAVPNDQVGPENCIPDFSNIDLQRLQSDVKGMY